MEYFKQKDRYFIYRPTITVVMYVVVIILILSVLFGLGIAAFLYFEKKNKINTDIPICSITGPAVVVIPLIFSPLKQSVIKIDQIQAIIMIVNPLITSRIKKKIQLLNVKEITLSQKEQNNKTQYHIDLLMNDKNKIELTSFNKTQNAKKFASELSSIIAKPVRDSGKIVK